MHFTWSAGPGHRPGSFARRATLSLQPLFPAESSERVFV